MDIVQWWNCIGHRQIQHAHIYTLITSQQFPGNTYVRAYAPSAAVTPRGNGMTRNYCTMREHWLDTCKWDVQINHWCVTLRQERTSARHVAGQYECNPSASDTLCSKYNWNPKFSQYLWQDTVICTDYYTFGSLSLKSRSFAFFHEK